LEADVAQAINRYRAEWSSDECNMVLDEVYRFVCDVTGPLNGTGDAQGCRIEDGRVITPDGFKDAWDKTWEAGWRTIASPSRWGGQDAPNMVGSYVEEMMCGANTAFTMYTGLTLTAAELIMEFGTEEQKQKYVPKMMSGEWTGTMCLTEPHAGSDVGAATTTATRNDDGTYNIRGTKIFISAGDNDLGTNVIHLVLARIEGAEAGTKGLSLFLVPRVRIEEDGSLGELNDEDGSIGEVVGGVEHQGIRQMFHMMNAARIGVGIQGLSVASAAYLSALEYARERKQGASVKQFKDANAPRVPIIEHPNIRRDLLAMKARVEGIRALVMKLSSHGDRLKATQGKDDESEAYHKGQVDLLTPLVKAYGTDAAFEVSSRAIQVYGGHGFLKDHPVEQYCRDAKIFQIYEGTNFIQSMDLVSRKLGQAGGANTQAFLMDIQNFITENKDTPELAEGIGHLQAAHEAVAASVMQFIGWFKGGKLEHIPLGAEDFLTIMSELAVGWLLLDQASIALQKLPETSETHPDHAFYTGKKFAAQYFANNVLTTLPSRTRRLSAIDTLPVEIPDEAFATV
jgi:alkylation response protein AidB-like acyl-CoA dehydrogenase